MVDRVDRRSRRGAGAAARRRAALERAGHVLSAATLFIAAVALAFGWAADIPVARGQIGGLAGMTPLAAVGFLAAGVSLLLLGRERGRWSRITGLVLGGVVAVLGAAILMEYARGADSGLGRLLFASRVAALPMARPGLPSPNTALCLLLSGAALLSLRPPGVRSPRIEWFALPVGFIALQALIGYAYGAEPLYRVSAFSPIPLWSAAGFLLLTAALLCLRPSQGLVGQLTSSDVGGFVARRLLVVSLVLPLVSGWLGLVGLRRGLFSLEVGMALIIAGGIFAVTGAVWASTRALSRADSKRRAALRSVRSHAARLRRAVDMSPFPQMIHADDGRVLQISRAWSELTGYAPEEIRTVAQWTELAYGTRGAAAREHIESLHGIEQRVDQPSEFDVMTQDGTMRTWLFSSAPLGRLRDGRRLVISAAVDVTERTRAEQELRQRNSQLAFLFNATSRLLASRDPLQLIETLYAEAAQLVELDVYFHYVLVSEETPPRLKLMAWSGIPDADAKGLEELDLGRPICGVAAARGRRIVCERLQQRRTGDTRVLRDLGVRAYVCHPLIARGAVIGTLSFGTFRRDRFTRDELSLLQAVADQVALAVDRARGEERERLARSGAEQASRAKDEFLAVVSHELRTPLTAVVGYTDLLQADVAGALAPAQRKFVERIRESAWSLASVIDEILTFARTQARQEEVRLERTDVVRIAREVANALMPEALRKGLTLHHVLPDGPRHVITDGGKLRRILTNLLGNAVKFTDAGEVVMRMEADPGWLRFIVSDTGPGIPGEHLERIFEPFQQVDASETRTKSGTGLGLTITRELAGLLGGHVAVETEMGSGSRFTVELPLAAGSGDERVSLSRVSGAGT
jgi:PAS domain S-box-containing protein